MSNIRGNLNDSAGMRVNFEEDDDSLAAWFRTSFQRQRDSNSTRVTMTDTQQETQ